MATQRWDSSPSWPWPYDEDITRYTEVPEWWLVGYEEVRGFIRGLCRAQIESVGLSAGKRELTILYYGPDKPDRTLCVTGGTHGTEVEGVSSISNVIRCLETGADLRGEQWPALTELAKRVGFYLMPFYSPDAAARNIVKSYVDMPFDAVNHLHVGFWKNGKTLDRKRVFGPWTPQSDVAGKLERISYLGQRFNDAGRLINRPKSRTKSMAVETMQMLEYLRARCIDCYVDLHSHSTPPWLGCGPAEQHGGDHAKQLELFELTRGETSKSGGFELALGYQSGDRWFNSPFFSANLGIYGFTYEAMAGFRGNYPAKTPLEDIWLANTYNGIHTIVGLARALLKVPSPWR
jgi:hypothetical protein